MGSKSSKRNSTVIEPLSRETIDQLCRDTGFSEEEIAAWHTNFYKDCPDGKLTLKQFEHEYAKVMGKPTQKTANYIRHMFSVYDQDKNQFIDFREFVMALSAASVVNRVRLIETLFHVFDLDNDGKITREEIGKMLQTLIDVTDSKEKGRSRQNNRNNSQEQKKRVDLQKRIDEAFNELNANDDDHITKDEFIEWYMKSGLLADVQKADIAAADPSRMNLIEKKSRKLIRQSSNMRASQDHDDNRHGTSHLVRHMTRMTERKPPSRRNQEHRTTTDLGDLDEDDDGEDENSMDTDATVPRREPLRNNIDDNGSQISKENERWQHLFNSLLGEIRSQRQQQSLLPNSQPKPLQSTSTSVTTSSMNGEKNDTGSALWKRKVRENFQSGQFGQRSSSSDADSNHFRQHDEFSGSNHHPSPSPDIITVRL